jgi:hypothetical protein
MSSTSSVFLYKYEVILVKHESVITAFQAMASGCPLLYQHTGINKEKELFTVMVTLFHRNKEILTSALSWNKLVCKYNLII